MNAKCVFFLYLLIFFSCKNLNLNSSAKKVGLFASMVNKLPDNHCLSEHYYNYYGSIVYWFLDERENANGQSYFKTILATSLADTFALVRKEGNQLFYLDANYEKYPENSSFPHYGKEYLLLDLSEVGKQEWEINTRSAIGSGAAYIYLESSNFDEKLNDFVYCFRAIPKVNVLPSHFLYVSRFSFSKKYGFLEFIHSENINVIDTACITSYYPDV